MTEEQKELLLKDLCSRLPYGVKISIPNLWTQKMEVEILDEIFKGDDGLYRANSDVVCIEYIRPYLFPLSSMNEEQLSYIHFNTKFNIDRFGTITPKNDEDDFPIYVDMEDWISLYGWLNKNHFDYRGLIEKGLAIDATGLNNIY